MWYYAGWKKCYDWVWSVTSQSGYWANGQFLKVASLEIWSLILLKVVWAALSEIDFT